MDDGTLTGSRVVDVLLFTASVVGAVVTLAGAVWWLLWPRVEDKLQAVVREVAGVANQLDPSKPGTTASNAKDAAERSASLPAIEARLAGLDRWRDEVNRRLGVVEQIAVALVGPELRRRLFEDIRTDLDDERRNSP